MVSSPVDEQVAVLVASRDWQRLRALLLPAAARDELDAAGLEHAAEASWWLGSVDECIELRRRAFEAHRAAGEAIAAARVALWLSEDHRRQARPSVAESWRRRAARLLDGQAESVEVGYLRLYEGEVARRRGRLDDARLLLGDALGVATRLADPDLEADVTQEIGRVMILAGALAEGMATMDEAMLTATEGELSPYTTGKIYCCAMSACDETGDVARMAEWERTSSTWSRDAGVNVFPGMCRVHYADLLAHHGQWPDAEREAERACEELREVGWVVAYAYNTIGHIRRRRGDIAGATWAYGRAEELGSTSEAGWCLLLLDQGDIDGALRRISRAVTASVAPPLVRSRLLPALVEIAVAAGDIDAATSAAAELDTVAATYETLKLQALAATARAQVCLARSEWVAACGASSAALRTWQELDAPYEVAVARVLLAHACRALDDHDGWVTSLNVAASSFESLGAMTDLAKVRALQGRRDAPVEHDAAQLTAREIDVLRHLATGATNRMIAGELCISEKTVARHLSNIFTKLGVSTRSAATAAGFQRGLVGNQR